jgi:adenylylsulfate kinase
MKRDPKGLYRKAREGAITGLTGYDAPYEEPKSPEITIDTQLIEVEPAARHIVDYLTHLGVLGRLRS